MIFNTNSSQINLFIYNELNSIYIKNYEVYTEKLNKLVIELQEASNIFLSEAAKDFL
ncbi:hypothetical protein [Spiroplasma taiwanense]|uniref:Uncharacterized protein n=1 Tax=Spiroplasma taiwanense CT-1 TaxID=1276220 RepID=S5LWP9_9MOLU|nr:hypothetical protein [Spiroplasma taiwanense]AGR41066.1 hypothetical protein STAIW_v1c04160 [Spiroplasma taiwanense CT-1]